MVNKLSKAGEKVLVGEDAIVVKTDTENQVDTTQTDFILVEQTPVPNALIGFDVNAELKQFLVSSQGQQFLNSFLPVNSYVTIDPLGNIGVKPIDSGPDDFLRLSGGELTGPLTITSGNWPQLKLRRSMPDGGVAITFEEADGNIIGKLEQDGLGGLTLFNDVGENHINIAQNGNVYIRNIAYELAFGVDGILNIPQLSVASSAVVYGLLTANDRISVGAGGIFCYGQIQSETLDAYQHYYPGPDGYRGYFWRNDGSNIYLLINPPNDNSNITDARPITINMPSGQLTLGGGTIIGGDTFCRGSLYLGWNNEASVLINGDIYGSIWGGYLNPYINNGFPRDIQLGAQGLSSSANGGGTSPNLYLPGGCCCTGYTSPGSSDVNNHQMFYKPIQKHQSGTWWTIAG